MAAVAMTRAAMLLGCLLGLLAVAAPAEAAWPGRDGAIVFARKYSDSFEGYSDLWIQTRSGGQRRLTATPNVTETEPTFSPDGGTIAYVRRSGEDADVWLMNSDGSGKRPLVDSALVNEEGPTFFPHGRRLAFTVFYSRRGWNVLSVKTNGGGRRLEADDAIYPSVSPDGRWLAYSQVQGKDGIRLLNLKTRKNRRLTPSGPHQLGPEGLDFSPDGKQILFSAKRYCRPHGSLHAALLTVRVSDGRERFLRRSCRYGYGGAVWAPSGRRIVYARYEVVRRQSLSRLFLTSARGRPLAGAPDKRPGARDFFATWQPLP